MVPGTSPEHQMWSGGSPELEELDSTPPEAKPPTELPPQQISAPPAALPGLTLHSNPKLHIFD